jgi:predicted permease
MLDFFRKLTRRRRLESEMRDEFAFHLQARIDDLIRSGLSAGEARRRARVEFGGADRYREELREARRFTWIEDFLRDFAYACRNLRRAPLFALSAASAIALGIGVNLALFSLVYGVLYRPLPVRDPATIRNVYMRATGNTGRHAYGSVNFVSFEEFTYLRDRAQTAELAGISESNLSTPLAPSPLHAQLVSDNLLFLTGARPALARFFTRDEARTANSGAVAVLSYNAWQKYFNGEDVTGRRISLNRTPFTIIGVAGQGFHGPLLLKPDLWIPLTMQPITRAGEPLINDPNAGWIQMIGRRKPGRTDSAMLAELQVLAQQTVSGHAFPNRAVVTISPGAFINYPEMMSQSIPVLAILFLAVSLLLLVACANVANMLIARGFSRSREIAIRLSVGAGARRLVRQLLTEHILLGLLGGAAGLVLSQIALRTLLTTIPLPGDHQLDISPDWRIGGWTFLVALAAGVLFGLPAALSMVRGGLAQSLRGDALDTGVQHRRLRLQSALIGTQVAVSALLLINAGLLVRAAGSAIHMDPGQAVKGVLIVKPNLRDLQYTPARAERYFRDMRGRAGTLPGVTAVSWTAFEPMRDGCGGQASPVQPYGSTVQISCNEIGADFLRTMRIRLLRGREFNGADADPAAKVAIVDESFARRFLPGNPLGRRIRIPRGPQVDDYEVVGVAASTRQLMLGDGRPQVYTPLTGLRYLEARLVISYEGPRTPLVSALQALAPQLDNEASLSIRPIEENVAGALSFVQSAAAAVGALGSLALLLASAGVYSVVAFTVGRRRREIGVRIALGAQAASVMRLLIRQSLRPVLVGGAIGTALAAGVSRLLRSLLYGVSPLDPLGFAGALFVLAAIAAAAAFVPASAALRVDPAVTLRHE